MTQNKQNNNYPLHLKRKFSAPREKVFQAWMKPKGLTSIWGAENNGPMPIVDVKLCVGGNFRLSMQPPNSKLPGFVSGTFREVRHPKKLEYTWCWQGEDKEESLISVEFHDLGDSTEVIMKQKALNS